MNLTNPTAPAALVHRDAHDTETQARDAILPQSGALRVRVLELLSVVPVSGLTDDEGGALLGGDRLTFGRRRRELVENGWAGPTGTRRPTPGGRSAVVWAITLAGRVELARLRGGSS